MKSTSARGLTRTRAVLLALMTLGAIAVAWLDWRLKGDQRAARMFKGADCTLCTAPSWHVTKSKID